MFKVNFVFKFNFKHKFRVRSGSWCRLGPLKESSQIYFQSTVEYLCKVQGKGSRAPVKEEGETVHILGPLQPLTLRHTPNRYPGRLRDRSRESMYRRHWVRKIVSIHKEEN